MSVLEYHLYIRERIDQDQDHLSLMNRSYPLVKPITLDDENIYMCLGKPSLEVLEQLSPYEKHYFTIERDQTSKEGKVYTRSTIKSICESPVKCISGRSSFP